MTQTEFSIKSPEGETLLLKKDGTPGIFITDLGYVYIKLWSEKEDSWINIKVSDIQKLLPKGYTLEEK